MTDTNTTKEMGLIKHLSARNGQLAFTQDKQQSCLDKASKSLVKHGGVEAVKEFRIDFGYHAQGYKHTTIGEYKNKKGKVSKCHYMNGKYYGSVKVKGENPILVLSWVEVNEDNFDKYWVVDGETGHLNPIRVDPDQQDFLSGIN